MPCAASARSPRSSRKSICRSTRASGTSNSLRLTSSATSLSLASRSAACLRSASMPSRMRLRTSSRLANSPSSLAKCVVQFGQALLLDGLHLHRVGERLAGETLVGEVLGIVDIEGPLVARGGSAQVLGEFGHGVLAARSPPGFRPCGPACLRHLFGLAVERDLGEVAIRERTAFDRSEGGVLLAQMPFSDCSTSSSVTAICGFSARSSL